MNVCVVFADAAGAQIEALELPEGALLADALRHSRLAQQVQFVSAGIWNHARAPDTLLREGDRIELYKQLIADPKDARRLRVERSREDAQRKKAAARKVTSGA
jgi:putative ubiquitin-RnfH superfamily antitoxin RatB of RatAB toxin-antitoxin module